MASAEQILVSCLGNLVLYNDISPTLALSFSSRVAYSRAVLKRNHGRDILVSAIDQLLLGEYLQIKTPILIDAIGILSMTSTLIETNFTQTAYNFLVSQKQQSTYIPDELQLK